MATQLDFNLPFASMNMNQTNSIFSADKKFASPLFQTQNPISNLKQSLNGFHVTTFNPFQSQATTGPTFGTTSPINNSHLSDINQSQTPRMMMNQSLSSVKFNFDKKPQVSTFKETSAPQINQDSVISQLASRLNAQFGSSQQQQYQSNAPMTDQSSAYDSNVESLHQSSEGEEQEAANEDDDEAANSGNDTSNNLIYPINVESSIPNSYTPLQTTAEGNDDVQMLEQQKQISDERHIGQFAAEVLESHNFIGHLSPGEEVRVVR